MAYVACLLLTVLFSPLSVALLHPSVWPTAWPTGGYSPRLDLHCNRTKANNHSSLPLACNHTASYPPFESGIYRSPLSLNHQPLSPSYATNGIDLSNKTISRAFAFGMQVGKEHPRLCSDSNHTSSKSGTGIGRRDSYLGEREDPMSHTLSTSTAMSSVNTTAAASSHDDECVSATARTELVSKSGTPSTATISASNGPLAAATTAIFTSQITDSPNAASTTAPTAAPSNLLPATKTKSTPKPAPLPSGINLHDPRELQAYELGLKVGGNMNGCSSAHPPPVLYFTPTKSHKPKPKQPTFENPGFHGARAYPRSAPIQIWADKEGKTITAPSDQEVEPSNEGAEVTSVQSHSTPSATIPTSLGPAPEGMEPITGGDPGLVGPGIRRGRSVRLEHLKTRAPISQAEKLPRHHSDRICSPSRPCSAGSRHNPGSSVRWALLLLSFFIVSTFCDTSATSPSASTFIKVPLPLKNHSTTTARVHNTGGDIWQNHGDSPLYTPINPPNSHHTHHYNHQDTLSTLETVTLTFNHFINPFSAGNNDDDPFAAPTDLHHHAHPETSAISSTKPINDYNYYLHSLPALTTLAALSSSSTSQSLPTPSTAVPTTPPSPIPIPTSSSSSSPLSPQNHQPPLPFQIPHPSLPPLRSIIDFSPGHAKAHFYVSFNPASTPSSNPKITPQAAEITSSASAQLHPSTALALLAAILTAGVLLSWVSAVGVPDQTDLSMQKNMTARGVVAASAAGAAAADAAASSSAPRYSFPTPIFFLTILISFVSGASASPQFPIPDRDILHQNPGQASSVFWGVNRISIFAILISCAALMVSFVVYRNRKREMGRIGGEWEYVGGWGREGGIGERGKERGNAWHEWAAWGHD